MRKSLSNFQRTICLHAFSWIWHGTCWPRHACRLFLICFSLDKATVMHPHEFNSSLCWCPKSQRSLVLIHQTSPMPMVCEELFKNFASIGITCLRYLLKNPLKLFNKNYKLEAKFLFLIFLVSFVDFFFFYFSATFWFTWWFVHLYAEMLIMLSL